MRREFPKDLSALGEISSFLGEFSREHDLGQKVEFYMNLVAEEIFTNALKYGTGNGERVLIRIDRIDDMLQFEMVDFDVQPFDPGDIEPTDLDAPIERRKAGGLGLYLVRSLVDDLTFEYEGGNLKVRVTRQLES